ncbi:hypothetical protein GCM10007172_21100 [Sinomonas atrocyanea]|nr:hypothetical protein GCM10007172_21100 [Sinomonas atrocyanea]
MVTVLGSNDADAEPEGLLAPPPVSEALVQAVRARAPTASTAAPLAASFAEKVISLPLLFRYVSRVLSDVPSYPCGRVGEMCITDN